MANIYELPLPDGSIVEVEGERPPTREEWMRAIGPKLAPNPKGGLPVVSDEGLLAKAQRVARPQQAQESLAAGLQAAQGATNIVEQGARQARLEGVRQQVADEDARNAEIRSKLAAAGQMAASIVPPVATTIALGPAAVTPPGIAAIMGAGTAGQMLAQRLQNRDIFEPSNLVESGVVGLVSPVGVGAMRAGSTIPQYLGQGLREGVGIGSAIEAGRGVGATMRGEEYRPDAQTAMTFGLSAGLATAGRGIEGTIANRAAQNANKLKQQGANTQATLTDMSMAQAQSGINDIVPPAVEPSPFDNYIARKAVIAAENRSDVAKERMLQQLIDDAALSEAKRDAARLGVEVDSNITERARNRVLKARQKHGDNLDAAIADITDRIEKSTPPMPEDLPPSTAGERRTTPAQDTEKFNARRISIYDDLVNQGVPADEANKAALALAGTKDSREYQLLYDRIFRVREGTTEAGAKPTKLTSLRDLTLENVGIPTPRDFEAERLQIELAAQQQEAAQAQARAAQGVEADVAAAERADAALLGGTSGEAQQTVDLVRQRIMADRMRRAVNLLQSEGLPVAAARALAGAESPQEYNYILGEVRARYGQPQAAPAPARQPVRQLRSLEELTPEAVGIEPAAPTPVRELTPAEEPQNAVQIESPAVPVLQPKGAGEGGKVELQPVEQGNVPEKAAAKAAKEEAVPDLTGISSMEEGRKLLSPAQNKEVDELQDLIYRSAARQGPETGYKPYNLTEKEIARGKELMAKYRPLWYRGADSPTLPTPAQQSPTVSTPANPSGVAAKEEVTPSVTVKRGKDFQTYGIYEAKVGDETYRIFRDKESGQWREEGVGMDDPTGMAGFLGYTKEEAINRLRDRQMKAMAAAPKKAAAPAPAVEAPKPTAPEPVAAPTPAAEGKDLGGIDKARIRAQKASINEQLKTAVKNAPDTQSIAPEGQAELALPLNGSPEALRNFKELGEKYGVRTDDEYVRAFGKSPSKKSGTISVDEQIQEKIRRAHGDYVTITTDKGTYSIANDKKSLTNFAKRIESEYGKGIDAPLVRTPPTAPTKIIPVAKKTTPETVTNAVGPFVSTDATRPTLSAAVKDGPYTVATDGRVMAIAVNGGGISPEKIAETAGGKWPNWRQVIPKEIKLIKNGFTAAERNATADTGRIISELNQIDDLLSDNKLSVQLHIDDGKLGISYQNPDTGDFLGEGVSSSQKTVSSIDPSYLRKVMESARKLGVEKLDVIANEAERAPVIFVADDKAFYLVMPVRSETPIAPMIPRDIVPPAGPSEIVTPTEKGIIPSAQKEITPVQKSGKDIIRERAKALQEARRATGVEPEPAPAAQEVPEPKTSPSPLNMEERNRLAFLNKKFSSKTGLSPNEEVERAALSVRAKASGQAGNVSTAALINIASPVAGGAVGYNLVQKRDNETEEEYKARKLAAAIAGVVGGTGVGVAASTVAKSFGKMKVNPSDPASIRKLAAMAEAPSDTRSLWQKAQQVLSSARGKYIGMSDTLRKLQRDVYAPHGLPVVEGSTSDLATAFDRVNAYSHHAAASTQEMTAIRDSFDGKELPYANSLITALRLEDYAKARLRNQAALDAKVAAAQGALLKAIDANKALRPAIKQAEKLKGQLRLAKDRLRRDPKNASLAARVATIEADYNTAAAMRDAAVSEAKKIYGARAAMRSAQDDYAKNYDKYRTGDITTQEALDLPNEMRAKIAAEFGPKGVAKFDAAVNKWRDVMRRNLENLRDSGLVSDNQFNAVVANNEFYAPFRFLQEELDRIESGINTEMGTSGPVIRAREGFTRKDAKLQNMFEAARANIYDARIRAAQNRFMRDRLEPLTRLDPTGQFIKRVDPGHRAPAGRTVVRYKDNGQTVALEVPTPVAESIAGPKYDPSFVVKLFQEGNMLARLGQTAGDVVFLATQAGFLDPMRAQTMSNYSVFGGRFGIKPMALAALPLHYASGLKSALKTNFLDLQDNLMSQAVKNDAISGSFFTSSDPRGFDLRQSLGESAKSVRSPSEMFDAVSGLITRSGQSLDQMTKLVGWQQALQQEKIRIPVSTTGGVTKLKEISLKDAITDPRANPDDVREAISRAAYEVSNFYGSPNFSKKMLGLQGASLVFTYIKAAVRGIETDARRALPLSDISSAMVGKPYDKARLSNSMKTWSKLAAFGAATGYVYSINMLPENRDDFEGIDKRERDRKIPIPLSKFTFDDGSTTVAPATTESMANFLGAKQEPYRTWSPRENKWVREYFMVPMQGPYTMLAKDLAEQTMRTESDNNPDFASVANEFAARHFPVNIDGDSFKERMVSIVSSAQPTMRLPAELMYNIDTFTQRPIITKNVEGSPELQFDPTRDPEFYRKAAQAVDAVLPDFAGDWQKSPQAIKQILESYVGSTRMLNTSVAREGSVQQNIPIIGQRVGVSGRPELGPKREIAQEAKRGAADEKTIEDNAVDAMIEEMNNPSSDPEKIRRFEEAISIVSKSERAKDRFKERMTSSQRNTSTEARMIASLGSKSAKVKYYSGILNQMGGDLEKFIPYATEMMQYGNDVASKEIMNEVIGSFVQQQAAGAR